MASFGEEAWHAFKLWTYCREPIYDKQGKHAGWTVDPQKAAATCELFAVAEADREDMLDLMRLVCSAYEELDADEDWILFGDLREAENEED